MAFGSLTVGNQTYKVQDISSANNTPALVNILNKALSDPTDEQTFAGAVSLLALNSSDFRKQVMSQFTASNLQQKFGVDDYVTSLINPNIQMGFSFADYGFNWRSQADLGGYLLQQQMQQPQAATQNSIRQNGYQNQLDKIQQDESLALKFVGNAEQEYNTQYYWKIRSDLMWAAKHQDEIQQRISQMQATAEAKRNIIFNRYETFSDRALQSPQMQLIQQQKKVTDAMRVSHLNQEVSQVNSGASTLLFGNSNLLQGQSNAAILTGSDVGTSSNAQQTLLDRNNTALFG